jgi:hypothetical protein
MKKAAHPRATLRFAVQPGFESRAGNPRRQGRLNDIDPVA